MNFNENTTFKEFRKECKIDFTLTINDIYLQFENDIDNYNPFEFVVDELSFHNTPKFQIGYLNKVVAEIVNKREIYEWGYSEFLNASNKRLNNYTNEPSKEDALINRVIKDYENGYCPPISKYQNEIEFYIEHDFFNLKRLLSIKGTSIKTVIESAEYTKCSILEDIWLSIKDCEILKYCNEKLNELMEFNSTQSNPLPKQLKRGKETTHKQQIILLKELGFFELPLVANLSIENRAKLIAKIINKDWTNGEHYERYYGIDKLKVPKDDYFVKAEDNLKFVNNLFAELGINKKVK